MKNKLAENMLRFGVKNLQESDIKKIEESILTEDPNTPVQPWKSINPTSLTFKNEKAAELAMTGKSYNIKLDPKMAIAGRYGNWARQVVPNGGSAMQMDPNAIAKAQVLAADLFMLLTIRGNYKTNSLLDQAKTLNDVEIYSTKIRNNPEFGGYMNPQYNFNRLTSGDYPMTDEQWKTTIAALAPAIEAVMQQYVLPNPNVKPKTTTPAPATPGTTTPTPVPSKRP